LGEAGRSAYRLIAWQRRHWVTHSWVLLPGEMKRMSKIPLSPHCLGSENCSSQRPSMIEKCLQGAFDICREVLSFLFLRNQQLSLYLRGSFLHSNFGCAKYSQVHICKGKMQRWKRRVLTAAASTVAQISICNHIGYGCISRGAMELGSPGFPSLWLFGMWVWWLQVPYTKVRWEMLGWA
jgi:hypothetical protein